MYLYSRGKKRLVILRATVACTIKTLSTVQVKKMYLVHCLILIKYITRLYFSLKLLLVYDENSGYIGKVHIIAFNKLKWSSKFIGNIWSLNCVV